MTTKNPAIGTCPCPITGCQETASVHQFATRAVRDTGRRFGGKLYIVCKAHGSLGLAAPKEMQEFILNHAKIDKRALQPVEPPAEPPHAEQRTNAPPAPPAPAPARAADPPPAATSKRSWGSVLDE